MVSRLWKTRRTCLLLSVSVPPWKTKTLLSFSTLSSTWVCLASFVVTNLSPLSPVVREQLKTGDTLLHLLCWIERWLIELLEQEDTKVQPLRESLSLEIYGAGFNCSDRPGGLGIAVCDAEGADHIRHIDII